MAAKITKNIDSAKRIQRNLHARLFFYQVITRQIISISFAFIDFFAYLCSQNRQPIS